MIKKCLFCGKKPTLHNWQSLITGKSYFSVECKNQGCTVQPLTNKEYKTRGAAVRAWNTRGL